MDEILDNYLESLPKSELARTQLVRSLFAVEKSRIVAALTGNSLPLLCSNRLEVGLKNTGESLQTQLESELEKVRGEVARLGLEAYAKHIQDITRTIPTNQHARKDASGMLFHGLGQEGANLSFGYMLQWRRDLATGHVRLDSAEKEYGVVVTIKNPWEVSISPHFGEYLLPLAIPNKHITEVIICKGFISNKYSTAAQHVLRLLKTPEEVQCFVAPKAEAPYKNLPRGQWEYVKSCTSKEALNDFLG
jgi:hypothetical protein